jgi:hypothetical protein
MVREEDIQIARRGNRADRQVERFFQRAPFIYTLIVALGLACAAVGAWTAKLQGRVETIEEFKTVLERDGINGSILEQAHANRKDIDRNSRQIKELNRKAFGLTEPE